MAISKILKFPLLTTVQILNHWSTDKLIGLMNQYWWGNAKKTAESANLACPTCPKYDPGKQIHTSPGHFRLLNEPFEIWQLDFMQLSHLMEISLC